MQLTIERKEMNLKARRCNASKISQQVPILTVLCESLKLVSDPEEWWSFVSEIDNLSKVVLRCCSGETQSFLLDNEDHLKTYILLNHACVKEGYVSLKLCHV